MILRRRGAGVLLSLALAGCLSARPPAPQPSGAPVPPSALARDAARVLARVSAYDYALAGAFGGERVRVVTPDRYAVALAAERQSIASLKDRVLQAAFADAALSGALIEVADAGVAVAEDLERFGDAKDDQAFARIVQQVTEAWSALRRLATLLPPDDVLSASIATGTSWTVTVGHGRSYAVLTAPYQNRDEAQQAARRIGDVEQVASSAPFTVRVVTTPDRDAAERRVAQLRDSGVVAASVEVERFTFSRAGPDPAAELWREPAVDVPTWGGARRANFIAGGIVVVSADGETFSFYDTGKLWWHAKLASGPSFATPSSDGRYVFVGGQSAQLLGSDGKVIGGPTRLPSAAAGAVWVGRRKVFVAASQGPTGLPGGGGGGVAAVGLDGKGLGDPFPLVTPAAGPAVASSPAREEVYIATTSQGATDVEVIRPGVDANTRTLARVAGQVRDLAIDEEGVYAVVVTSQGTYRFRPGARDATPTLERLADAARDVVFARDGTLYALFPDKLVAYDRGLRTLWTTAVSDGRRALVARRVIVQDGLRRLFAVDVASGAADELASLGEIDDVAVSPDGGKVLLLAEGRRAVIFNLP